ncbi:MAG: hypothetical protein MHPSP_001242 [Paramarteilia canceri]
MLKPSKEVYSKVSENNSKLESKILNLGNILKFVKETDALEKTKNIIYQNSRTLRNIEDCCHKLFLQCQGKEHQIDQKLKESVQKIDEMKKKAQEYTKLFSKTQESQEIELIETNEKTERKVNFAADLTILDSKISSSEVYDDKVVGEEEESSNFYLEPILIKKVSLDSIICTKKAQHLGSDLIICSSADSSVSVIKVDVEEDFNNLSLDRIMRGPQSDILSFCFDPLNQKLVCCTLSEGICHWEFSESEKYCPVFKTLMLNESPIFQLEYIENPEIILGAMSDGHLVGLKWGSEGNYETEFCNRIFEDKNLRITSFLKKFQNESENILVSDNYGDLYSYPIENSGLRAVEIFKSSHKDNSPTTAIAFDSKKNVLFVGDQASKITILDIRSPEKEVAQFVAHCQPISDLQMWPDSNYLLSGSDDGTFRVWDTRNYNQNCCLFDNFAHHPKNGKGISSILIFKPGICITAGFDGILNVFKQKLFDD